MDADLVAPALVYLDELLEQFPANMDEVAVRLAFFCFPLRRRLPKDVFKDSFWDSINIPSLTEPQAKLVVEMLLLLNEKDIPANLDPSVDLKNKGTVLTLLYGVDDRDIQHVKNFLNYPLYTANGIFRYLSVNPSSCDVWNFIRIIECVHRQPGRSNQFIAVYSPSLTGKTQLAFTLDRYTATPLHGRSRLLPPQKAPLQMCLRLPCESVVSHVDVVSAQDINICHVSREALRTALALDLDYLGIDADRNETEMAERLSLTKISDKFNTCASQTLAVFERWMTMRKNGKECQSLQSQDSFDEDLIPLTIPAFQSFISEIFPGMRQKPIVVVLDEFSLVGKSKTQMSYLIFLRNLLRRAGTVVILMGTNASASNMVSRASFASGSGLEDAIWAQVVTNVFSCSPISQFSNIDALTRKVQSRRATLEPILKWLEKGYCLKPGAVRAFLNHLELQPSAWKPSELVEICLNKVYSEFQSRKSMEEARFNYLRGQVEAMISATRSASEQGERLAIFLNHHYAHLTTPSSKTHLPFFAIARSSKSLVTYSWFLGVTGNIQLALHHTTYEINGYSLDTNVKAPICVSSPDRSPFIDNSGFPSFDLDELSYLAYFAGPDPFSLTPGSIDTKAGAIFGDLIQKGIIGTINEPGNVVHNVLTTRGAFTIAYRYQHGAVPVDPSPVKRPSRPGFFLEITANASLVVASHKSGLSGSTFSDFLPRFVGELALFPRVRLVLSPGSIKALGPFAKFVVPFIPILHATCSKEFRAIPGVNTGTLRLCKDSEQVDGSGLTDCLLDSGNKVKKTHRVTISTEMKSYENAVDATDLRGSGGKGGIIHKAVDKAQHENQIINIKGGTVAAAHFHFVTVSKLANITNDSWANIALDFPEVSIYVVDKVENGIVTLKCVVGPQTQNTKGRPRRKATKVAVKSFKTFEIKDCPVPRRNPQKLEIPICIIITPVEDIFPEDGPFTYTSPPLQIAS